MSGLPVPHRCADCNRDGNACECGLDEDFAYDLLLWRLRKSVELTKNPIKWKENGRHA